jgi:glycosyltransferase involved in cell wall biosynthesis
LQVSSFQERKGHKYTLEAFKRFIDLSESKPYYFIIVGLGELEGEIKDQIKALQLSNFVEVREPITPAEMVELSSKVNCFVHMSVTTKNGQMEGLPNVILEAMSLELPIMATLHAGIPEIVEHGKNGILCEERSIEEYVEAFKTIVTWKPLSINREKIIEQFSLKSHMKKLFVIYDELTKRKVWS